MIPDCMAGVNTQGAMNATEGVVGEARAERGPVVLPLFAEAVPQARESAHLHSHREVLAFDMRSANLRRVGISEDWGHLRAHRFSG